MQLNYPACKRCQAPEMAIPLTPPFQPHAVQARAAGVLLGQLMIRIGWAGTLTPTSDFASLPVSGASAISPPTVFPISCGGVPSKASPREPFGFAELGFCRVQGFRV